jgi:hypothetical protein
MIELETTSVIDHAGIVSLETRRDTLAARLETGFNKIEEAERAGQDITRWEQAWNRLLTEYEDVCNQIARRPQSHAS